MSFRTHISRAMLLALSAGSLAMGQASERALDVVAADNAMTTLTTLHPGIRKHEASADQFVNTRLFGKRMTVSNISADDAAEKFIAQHIDALGVRDAELVLSNRVASLTSNNVVYHYQQYFGGVPVEGTNARIVVKEGEQNAVVYVSGRLAPEPVGGFAQPAITAEDAIERVKQNAAYKDLPVWYDAELVVYFNENAGETTLAWKFTGGTGVAVAQAQAFEFFVDAGTAEILEARDIIHNADIPTTVQGLATPGAGADTAANPPVLMPIRNLIVENQTTGETAASDDSGLAIVPNTGGGATVQIGASFNDGIWLDIDEQSGTPVQFEGGMFTEGMGGTLTFGDPPSELVTAQVNAFIHTNLMHDFMNTYAPAITGVDIQLTTNVNIDDSCNASFSTFGGLSINFFTSGVSFSGLVCNNTAFSSVVAHEYGHLVVNRLGLGQAEFGEGYGDACSMLLYDEPLIGIDFIVGGGVVRDPVAADLQFPCAPGGSVHFCGQVLGALWWDIRQNFGTTYGSAAGLEQARVLFGNWSLVTGGGVGGQSVHPATAIELLIADDDDGNLDNGTPNYADICAALASRNIDCPELALLSLSFDAALPAVLPANQAFKIVVNVEDVAGQAAPDSGTLDFSVDGGGFTSIPMTELSPGVYSAEIPGATCLSIVDYFFSVDTLGGQTVTSPSDAPSTTFSAIAAESTATPYETAFEIDNGGFTAGVAGDTATTGQWTSGNPNGTTAQPENDNTPDPGVNCFFTGQADPGDGQGTNDVDGGFTTLLSPVIDLTGFDAATISYFRWYANDTGADPNADVLRVDIREAGGTWVPVEVVGPSGPETTGGWFQHEFEVGPLVTLPASVQLRVIAEDGAGGSIVEAAFDDMVVTGISCELVKQPVCPGDCDESGTVDFNDLVAMLFEFGNNTDAGCDPDDSGSVDFNDLVATLFVFGPCPA